MIGAGGGGAPECPGTGCAGGVWPVLGLGERPARSRALIPCGWGLA